MSGRRWQCAAGCGSAVRGELPPPSWRAWGGDPERYLCQDCAEAAQAWAARRNRHGNPRPVTLDQLRALVDLQAQGGKHDQG